MDNTQLSFNIDAYLESNTQAASRVRSVIGLLVTVCVLTFVGFLSSYKYGWMNSRLKDNLSYSAWRDYMGNKFSNDSTTKIINTTEWEEFRGSYFKSYIDNALYVRMPFFGIAFDINYLGLMSSIALIIVYALLYLCLNSEQSNLALAFRAIRFHLDKWIFSYLQKEKIIQQIDEGTVRLKEQPDFIEKSNTFFTTTGTNIFINEPQEIITAAVNNYRSRKKPERKQLILTYREIRNQSFLNFNQVISAEGLAEMDNFYNFYRLIASRQVFVLPFIEGIERNQSSIFKILSKLIPMVFCFLPVIILGLIIKHDIDTSGIGNILNSALYKSSMITNIILFIIVLVLGMSCFRRYAKIDELWDEKWEEIKYYKSYLFFLNKNTYIKTHPYPKFLK